MHQRLIRASALAIATVAVSTTIAFADGEPPPEPPIYDATVTCHRSVDPGFIATIEDRSNDREFFTTFEDISNDSGFLYPVQLEPQLPGDEPAPCPSVVPLPTPNVEP